MKRFLFVLLFLVVLGGGAVLYARYIEPSMLRVEYLKLEEGPGLRILFFSDTHFGKDYPQENIERIVERINSNSPDIVVFGGDFYDNYSRDKDTFDLDYMKAQLASISGVKLAVWGNHDYGGGAEPIYRDVIEAGGFRLLTNESLYLDAYNLTVTGYDELYYGERDEHLMQLSTGTYNLLLAHEPDTVLDILSDTPGLLLGGHSHGGQVSIPFLKPVVLPDGARTFYKGLYPAEETGGFNQVFVTSGLGTSIYPFRFLNMPEVVVLDLGGSQ